MLSSDSLREAAGKGLERIGAALGAPPAGEGAPVGGVNRRMDDDWRSFEDRARQYFSKLWSVDLQARTIRVDGQVGWKFDLVSPDLRTVGDAKWLKNIKVPAAKWSVIAEYVWLLQKVQADRAFMVFGHDIEVAERWLRRMRSLTAPVEFYFLGGAGHRRI